MFLAERVFTASVFPTLLTETHTHTHSLAYICTLEPKKSWFRGQRLGVKLERDAIWPELNPKLERDTIWPELNPKP